MVAKVDHGPRLDLRKLPDSDLLELERLILKARAQGEHPHATI